MSIFWYIWYRLFKKKIDREIQEMEEDLLKSWGLLKRPKVPTEEQKQRMKERLKEYMRQNKNTRSLKT